MKKYLAWLLAAVMILSLVGCGKQQETTEDTQKQADVSTEVPAKENTAASTEASTEAPTEAPALGEEEAFGAWVGHIKELAEAIKDRENKDAASLSLRGSAELAAALTLTQGEEKQEFPLSFSGRGTARLNTAQGAEAEAAYKADLGVLAGMFSDSAPGTAEEQYVRFFLDFEEEKEYRLEDDGETWTWSDLSINTEAADLEQLDELTIDKLFAEHSFKAAEGRYVFEGKVALDKLTEGESGLAGELGEFGLDPDALTPQLRLVLDADCHLESLILSVEPLSLDVPLGELTTITVNLNTLKLELAADRDEVKIEIPAEVKEKAKEREDDPFEDPTEEVRDLGSVVVLDNELLKITAVSAGFDILDDYEITFEVENKSDKALTLRAGSADVNGWMADFYLIEDLEAGESKQVEASIDSEDLEKIGIEEPDEVLIRLSVREMDNYMDDPLLEESFAVYPTGKTADAVVRPDRRTTDNEVVLVDNDDFTVIILGSEQDDMREQLRFELYAENKTDKEVSIDWDDPTVNGKEIDVWFMEDLPAGTRAYFVAYIYYDDMKEAGIESVDKLSFTLLIEDNSDWSADPLFEQEFEWEETTAA